MGRPRQERKQGVTRKKEIDKEVIGTCLYVADKAVLNEDVKRTGKSKSELVREVYHAYAMKKRFGVMDTDEATVASTMKKLLAEVTEARTDIQAVAKQTKETTASVEGLTELNATEFKRVSDIGLANFNLATQVFTVVWAILDFVQRFVANRVLSTMEEFATAPQQESERQIHDARTEGLQFVEEMSDDLRSPIKPTLVLIGDLVAGEE